MMEKRSSKIIENIKSIREQMEQAAFDSGRQLSDVALMAVTKTVPAEFVNVAVGQGITLLGENRAQELLEKFDHYDPAAQVHFIGALQTNKVRQIIDKVSMIQSVDRLSLAQEIQRQCMKANRRMDVLVEVNIGAEESKSGISPQALREFLHQISEFDCLCIRGLMTIPPPSNGKNPIEAYFAAMREIFIDMKAEKLDNASMDILSMGMSGDFVPAIRHGANLVRLGSAIFGQRC